MFTPKFIENGTNKAGCSTERYLWLSQELAGSPVGPQIMLYYGPDLLRREEKAGNRFSAVL